MKIKPKTKLQKRKDRVRELWVEWHLRRRSLKPSVRASAKQLIDAIHRHHIKIILEEEPLLPKARASDASRKTIQEIVDAVNQEDKADGKDLKRLLI